MQSLLKISEASSLALHSMIVLVEQHGKPVSVKEIAEILEVSANHLSKVLQRLTKAGFVSSSKGKNGGFLITKAPSQITLLDIYESIEGKFEMKSCLLGNKICHKRTSCNMGGLVKSVNNLVKNYLVKTKLSSFASSKTKKTKPTLGIRN